MRRFCPISFAQPVWSLSNDSIVVSAALIQYSFSWRFIMRSTEATRSFNFDIHNSQLRAYEFRNTRAKVRLQARKHRKSSRDELRGRDIQNRTCNITGSIIVQRHLHLACKLIRHGEEISKKQRFKSSILKHE